MRKFLIYLFFIISFLFSNINLSYAKDCLLDSMVMDNSVSVLSLNSSSLTEEDEIKISPLKVIEGENKAYIDIESAILGHQIKNISLNSSSILQVEASQYSLNPNVVRITFTYQPSFNVNNISVKFVKGSILFILKKPNIQNYYFETVYSDKNSSSIYENSIIKILSPVKEDNVLNSINSAFNVEDASKKYEYINTIQLLQSKYYLNNIVVKNSEIYLTGMGYISVKKPFILSNPARIVYDLPNTIVNSSIVGKEFQLDMTNTVKVGQFDKNTARIVISLNDNSNYIPLIFGDSQRVVFVKSGVSGLQTIFSKKYALNKASESVVASDIKELKLVFSGPIVYSIERTDSKFDLTFYNVDRFQNIDLQRTGVFPKSAITTTKSGDVKFSLPTEKSDVIDMQIGNDGKTVRIKLQSKRFIVEEKPPEIKVEPAIVPKAKSSGKAVIVLDAGHGGSDCGATRNGIYEKNITLDVTKRVEKLLKQMGYVTYMTRSDDTFVSLQDRVAISESITPDIFVSIHVNSSNSDSPSGLETHYYKENSLQLAKVLHSSLINNIKSTNRGLFKSKFYVINHTTAPAVLLEIGFISNPTERAQLVSETRKQATAKAIAEGINAYFKNK